MRLSVHQKINKAKIKIQAGVKLAREAERELGEMENRVRQANINLSMTDAGRLLGKSARTIRRWLDSGKLKSTNFIDVYNYLKKERKSSL